MGAGIGQPASGGWEPAFGGRRMGAGLGSRQLADGSWDWAAGIQWLGASVAAGGRLFDDGAGVVFGVVAEGDFGNVYTLTYW